MEVCRQEEIDNMQKVLVEVKYSEWMTCDASSRRRRKRKLGIEVIQICCQKQMQTKGGMESRERDSSGRAMSEGIIRIVSVSVKALWKTRFTQNRLEAQGVIGL